MGRVWRAADEILDRQVAVKEMRIDGLDPEDTRTRRERTLREARATARIDHPHVVRIYDVVDEGERLWIVMELVDGRSLERLLFEDGPLDVRETARIGLELVDALGQVHAQGVLHRDIKPANVLVRRTGGRRVVLTDFGIAAIQDAEALTMAGMLVGSPDYMAPERVSGRPQGPPSDLWSLGATLCAALGGRSPFSRTTTLATLHAVLYEEPELPATAGDLHDVLAALLEKDPDVRPGLPELTTALQTIATPPPAPPTATVTLEPPTTPMAAPEPGGAAAVAADPPGGVPEAADPRAAGSNGAGPRIAGRDTPDPRVARTDGPDPRGAETDAPDQRTVGRAIGPEPSAVGAVAPEPPGGAGEDIEAADPGDDSRKAAVAGAVAEPPVTPTEPSREPTLVVPPAPVPPTPAQPTPMPPTPAQPTPTPTVSNAPVQPTPTPTVLNAPETPPATDPEPETSAAASPLDTPELPTRPRPAPTSPGDLLGRVRKVPPAPRRLARPLAAPGGGPSTSSTRASARHAESTHQTPQGAPSGRTTGLYGHDPGPPRPARPAEPRRNRRRTVLIAAAGVAVAGVLAAVLVPTLGASSDDRRKASPSTLSSSSPTVAGTSRPPTLPPGARTEAGVFAWVPPDGFSREVHAGAEVHYTSPDARQEIVGKASLARGDLLAQWEKKEESTSKGPGYQRIRLEETEFRGKPAVVWEYTVTAQELPWHVRSLGFNTGGKSYQLTTWYHPDIEDRALPVYKKVEKSFTPL
ncbi:serine/threonine-protein kinase [Streptomyces neyagawaensis]|uniref:serine/threonine-protein kinase n=2 Tax=Streptomyces TaxID=1883 RepID=UPI0035563920